jgi:hypothetical protein
LRKFISFNGISVVGSFSDLIKEITLYQQFPKRKLFERILTRNQETVNNDGKATERVVNSIVKILKEKQHEN